MVPEELSQSKLFSALDGVNMVYFDVRLHETALVVAREVIFILVKIVLTVSIMYQHSP